MTIEIVPIDTSRTRLLDNLAPEVFDNPIDPLQLTAFVDDPRHVMFVAMDEGLVVGMASAVEYFHPDKPPQLWINEVGVALTHRQRGIGRRLVQALLDEAESRGCVFAWLGTDTDNKPAQACFGSVAKAEGPQPFLMYEWALQEES